MKIIIAIWMFILSASAADVQLAWDANQASDSVTNYMVYAHTNELTAANLSSAVVKKSVGTNVTVKLEGLTGSWWFAVTAGREGLESEPSNIVTGTWEPPKKAQAPANMRFASLFAGPYPNTYLTKYFRLRW